MQLNQATDYAVRTVKYLAEKKSICPASEIAKSMKIPQSYLTKVLFKLKKAQIIETYAGQKGGYTLKQEIRQITVLELMQVMEGTIKINRCLEPDRHCSRQAENVCEVRIFYTKVQEKLEKMLREMTVEMLLGEND